MKVVGNVQLVRGDETTVPQVLALLVAMGIETFANPDIDIRSYPQFTVDDARALVERTLTKSLGPSRRVFIVVSPNMTYEAQNTLLKTLEEAPGDALFFLVVPAPDALLPTIRSRAQMLLLDETPHEALDVAAFLHASPASRLEMLKPLLMRDEDDVRDISGIVNFLGALERTLGKEGRTARAGLDAVYSARKYVGDKGSLLKTLLEQVALITPRV